jgi:hypothetical protein
MLKDSTDVYVKAQVPVSLWGAVFLNLLKLIYHRATVLWIQIL